MDYDYIRVEKREHITVVTMNRPEVMNALHLPANLELNEAFDDFVEDDNAWVAIVTGAGDKAFSVGNDLKWQAAQGIDVRTLVKEFQSLKGGFGGITRRFDCFKPIIAAVNGIALGGGFEIALSSDIIVAAENASFGLPEPRIGAIAGAGGIQRLAKKAPYQLAMAMILTGNRISAQEAQRLGLINEIVKSEELMPTAERWASAILECAPLAVSASKEGFMLAQDVPLCEIVGEPFPGWSALFQSHDLTEGSVAFEEKREPRWKGR